MTETDWNEIYLAVVVSVRENIRDIGMSWNAPIPFEDIAAGAGETPGAVQAALVGLRSMGLVKNHYSITNKFEGWERVPNWSLASADAMQCDELELVRLIVEYIRGQGA